MTLENNAYDNFTEIETREIRQPISSQNISIEVPLNQSPVNKSKYTERALPKRSDKSNLSPVRLMVPQSNTQETVPPWNYIPCRKATKNIIRRNSYDMAIGRYTVLCGKYGEDMVRNGRTSSRQVAYENNAFNDGSLDYAF